ncbi:MAG TPA: hypothetical protein ENH11_04310 [Candidatus Acetothermia bacterium]|nr:hypothetical protein [Candidatus Acetothermia bacterium]
MKQPEVSSIVAKLAHDAPPEERVGCMVLLAAARISEEGSRAMQRNLVASLRYWFSYAGTKSSSADLKELLTESKWRDMDLLTCMGLYLSWPEAMHSVGASGDDYTALKRLKDALRSRYSKEWQKTFGSPAPSNFAHGR